MEIVWDVDTTWVAAGSVKRAHVPEIIIVLMRVSHSLSKAKIKAVLHVPLSPIVRYFRIKTFILAYIKSY